MDLCGGGRPRDKHQEGTAREQQVGRARSRDQTNGREDDVRPKAEGCGPAHCRRAKQAGHAEEVHVRTS